MKIKSPFAKDKKTFEEFLKNYCVKHFVIQDSQQKKLKNSITYTLLAKASRFRALVSLSTTRLLNQNEKKILPWAAAIEMFHSGSLIHDDMPCMDNSKTRRGKKCNHLVFGEAVAVLAGSSLFIESFSLISSPAFKSKKQLLWNLFISKTGFSALMSGQALDLNKSKLTTKKSLQMIQWKTASLIEASVEGPAILWLANKKQRLALKDYGSCLGLAYQIADDLKDKDSPLKNPEKLLKRVTSDSLKALSPFKDRAQDLKTLSLLNEQRAFKT